MKRKNNRKVDESRPIKIELGVVPNANGSAMFSLGRTTAIAAVYGPRVLHPRRLQMSNRTLLRAFYTMVPFSTDERVRPGPSRRSTEICKVTREALEPVLMLDEFPKTTIDVFINIVQADAGTRTVGINAASLALADAGIPMKDLVASVAAGKIDGEYVLDLEGKEEEATACDLPLAYIPSTKQITLLQMDGDMTVKDVKGVMETAVKGAEKIYQLQRNALKEKWILKE